MRKHHTKTCRHSNIHTSTKEKEAQTWKNQATLRISNDFMPQENFPTWNSRRLKTEMPNRNSKTQTHTWPSIRGAFGPFGPAAISGDRPYISTGRKLLDLNHAPDTGRVLGRGEHNKKLSVISRLDVESN